MAMDLGLTREELREEIGRFLGYGRTWADFSTGMKEDVNALIRRGLRQFYSPPPIAGNLRSHEWNFLRPTKTMTLSADVTQANVYTSTVKADITIGVGGLSSTVSLDAVAARFPSWAGTSEFIYDDVTYEVRSVNAALTVLTLETGLLATAASVDFTLRRTYDMPTNFGGIIRNMTYSTEQGRPDVIVLNESRWLQVRTSNPTRTTRPEYVMFTPKTETDGISDLPNQWRANFFPLPNQDYTLEYQYLSIQTDGFSAGTVTGATGSKVVELIDAEYPEWAGSAYLVFTATGNEYDVSARTDNDTLLLTSAVASADVNAGQSYALRPKRFPGGTQHSETILASCLAVSEEYGETPSVRYRELFQQRLAASIAIDGQGTTAGILGQNLDRSDGASGFNKYALGDYNVTVDGVLPS